MAVKQKHDSAREALIAQAAAEVRRSNPHIGEIRLPYPDEEYAELVEDSQRLALVWDDIDQQLQRAEKSQSYTAADAVDEDRGDYPPHP
ncbi:MAG TPA: hypothetical protein VGF38_22420 [Ktedonobacterales bacterium]|jgi:hypothetical protein